MEPEDAGSCDGRAHPWKRACAASRLLFAHPEWGADARLDALLSAAEPAVGDGFAALLLGFDPRGDGLVADRDAACEAVALRVLELDPRAQVHVVLVPDGLAERRAAAGAVDGLVVPWSFDRVGALEGLVRPSLRDAQAVAAWRREQEASAADLRRAG